MGSFPEQRLVIEPNKRPGGGGGGYSSVGSLGWGVLPVLQILSLFQTKTCHFALPFSVLVCSHCSIVLINIPENTANFVGVCSSIEKNRKRNKTTRKTTTKWYNGSKSAPVEFTTVNMDLE